MRWANKSKDALPPFDEMKWLLAVAGVALHNQLIREVLEAWSLAAFGHVFFEWKSSSLLHFALLFGPFTFTLLQNIQTCPTTPRQRNLAMATCLRE